MAADFYRTWSNELANDAVRLVAFQRWLCAELGTRLVWPIQPERARRQIGQCSSFVEVAVADLAKRGWLFRPADLARILIEQLDHIATYQRKGGVRDLYKYLERAWDNWAGKNAEELSQAARDQNVHRAHMEHGLPPSLPEIVLKDLEARDQEIKDRRRFRSALQRARQPRCNDAAAPLLPGF